MKNISSLPTNGKRFVLLFLFSLFFFCAPFAAAQDKSRRHFLIVQNQSETGQTGGAETAFERARLIEAAKDSAAKSNLYVPARSGFGGENHGIVSIALEKFEEVKTITESERFAAPKIETKREKFFSPTGGESLLFIRQSNDDPSSKKLVSGENSSFSRPLESENLLDDRKKSSVAPPALDAQNGSDEQGFRWRPAIQQALLFLAVQHGYALTQPKTREALKGRFFHDYVESVKSLRGWADGGRFFTNYIAHPMQGSFVGFIQIQNDPKGMKQRFGGSGDYWRSRLKAMAWSAAWSTQFEIGPISQASIGNVGLKGKQTYVDLVMTPTLGTAMLITEDALDRFVIERIERGTNNFYLRIFSRMLLNPTRTVANLIRFKHPWHRDRARAR